MMSRFVVVLIVLVAALPSIAAAQSCSQQIDEAKFFGRLKPGHDSNLARRYLKRAKKADSDASCLAQLRAANFYAERSMGEHK